MNHQEFTAVEGLLNLYSYPPSSSSQVSLQSYDSEYSVRLSPISPPIESTDQRLPSIAQVLSSSPPSDIFASPTSSLASLNLHVSTPICPSMSSSCSTSTVSSISSYLSDHAPQQAARKTLRRTTACIFPANRRGRPRKNINAAAPATTAITTSNTNTNKKGGNKGKKKNESDIKIIKNDYERVAGLVPPTVTVAAAAAPIIPNMRTSVDVATQKPRWQDVERQTLMEVIVKQKELDNMASIPWDKVSKVVGRAKKACQDQWRREMLPYLLKGFVHQHQRSFENNDSEVTDKQ